MGAKEPQQPPAGDPLGRKPLLPPPPPPKKYFSEMQIEPRSRLMLFVWTEFAPDYKGGMAFAIAETLEEARQMVTQSLRCEVCDWGCVEVYPVETKVAFAIYGGQ